MGTKLHTLFIQQLLQQLFMIIVAISTIIASTGNQTSSRKQSFLWIGFIGPTTLVNTLIQHIITMLDTYPDVGCSSGYNLGTYPQYADINIQVVEQANSTLSRIRSSLAYMTPKHFCKLYIWYRNKCKELKS